MDMYIYIYNLSNMVCKWNLIECTGDVSRDFFPTYFGGAVAVGM